VGFGLGVAAAAAAAAVCVVWGGALVRVRVCACVCVFCLGEVLPPGHSERWPPGTSTSVLAAQQVNHEHDQNRGSD
jgi:hypothetical protein